VPRRWSASAIATASGPHTAASPSIVKDRARSLATARDCRISTGPVIAAPGKQPHHLAVTADDQPVAVDALLSRFAGVVSGLDLGDGVDLPVARAAVSHGDNGQPVGVYTLDSASLSRTHSSRQFAPVAYELSWLNFDACTLRLGEQLA
jgi:hypothetical protein